MLYPMGDLIDPYRSPLYTAGQLMAMADRVFSEMKYRRSWVCLLMMFVLTNLDVGVTQHQQRDIDNVSRVIEDLLETYDIRLRPHFGGRRHDI